MRPSRTLFEHEVERSEGDRRAYRVLELGCNGLQAVLVSDPKTDKAAAAMDVRVGHLSDPDHVPGLAHFLEHMLFLGTEKYPDENSYASFLSQHNGKSNAFTGMENTNYFFDVSKHRLEGALDRFSQFFVCPLFNASATEREMQAVHAENQKNLQNDSWRLFQLLKSTSKPHHPFSKFGTGNIDTLKTIPKEQGIHIRDPLLAFHRKHYTANRMKLVVLGAEPLDMLQDWVESMFAPIPAGTQQTQTDFGFPLDKKHTLGQCVHVVPIKDLRRLRMVWPIPSTLDTMCLDEVKPHQFLGHLLGHEGPGSILALLRKKQWATDLGAGVSCATKSFSLFTISIEMTAQGLLHADTIAAVVHAYIDLAQQQMNQPLLSELYNDMARLSELSFRFKEREDPFRYVSTVAQHAQLYPLQHVLSGPWLYRRFDSTLITSMLNYMSPNQCRLELISKSVEGVNNDWKQEKWYGTKYAVKPQLKTDPGDLDTLLHLPHPNPFLCRDFSIKEVEMDTPFPRLVHEKEPKVWFKQDNVFKKPKLHVNVLLSSPHFGSTVQNAVRTKLLIALLEDALVEELYNAELAGLRFHVSKTRSSLDIRFSGYNEKLQALASTVLNRLFHLTIDDGAFHVTRDKLERACHNWKMNQPHSHAVHYRSLFMLHDLWDVDEKIAAYAAITVEEMRFFLAEALECHHMEVLVHGNATQKEAIQFAKHCYSFLSAPKTLFSFSDCPECSIASLEGHDAVRYRRLGHNADDKNDAALVGFQIGKNTVESSSVCSLFAHLVREPCFDTLRTKEQLGYIVWSFPLSQRGVLSFEVLVQSSERASEYVETRIDAFLRSCRSMLESMSEETFAKHRQAVVDKLLEKPKKMAQETTEHYNQIIDRQYQFDRREIEAKYVLQLSKDDVLQFYNTFIAPEKAPERRKYVVHVAKTTSVSSNVTLEEASIITSPKLFCAAQPAFPRFV